LGEVLAEETPAGSHALPPEGWFAEAVMATTAPVGTSTPVSVQGCVVGIVNL
jgi:hypothetical protein